MLFDVHVYPIVRLKVTSVEAATHREAIDNAHAIIPDVGEVLEFQPSAQYGGRVEYGGYAEEVAHYVVDVCGDKEYQQTRDFDGSGNPIASRRHSQAAAAFDIIRRVVEDCEDGYTSDGLESMSDVWQSIYRDAKALLESDQPQPAPPTILITIMGGTLRDVEDVPSGIAVELHDYDTDGSDDDVEEDDSGDKYRRTVWTG